MNYKLIPLPALLFAFSLLIISPSLAQTNARGVTDSNSLQSNTLSQKQVENLFAFSKVYGYVKYFYPIKKKEKINWSYIAAHGVQEALHAEDEAALRESLMQLFGPIAPLLTIRDKSDVEGASSKGVTLGAIQNDGRYYYNLHQGLGQDREGLPILTRKLLGSTYKSTVMAVDENTYLDLVASGTVLPVDSSYSASLTQNLYCSFPLVVTENVFNSNRAFKKYNKTYELDLRRHQDRIATLLTFWNIFQHFHPYLDNTAGWENIFFETMCQMSPNMSVDQFQRVGGVFVASLKDGHAGLAYTNATGIYKHGPAPYIETAWVDKKLVISKVNITSTDIKPGDVIGRIDSLEAAVLIEKQKWFTPTANENNADLAAAERVLGWYQASNTPVDLTLIDSAGNKKVAKFGGQTYTYKEEIKAPAIREIEAGVYYMDASRVNGKVMKDNLDALRQAKSIVIDLRTRPSYYFLSGVIPYFITEEVETGNWSIPHNTFPDQQHVNYKKTGNSPIKPNGKFLSANKAFLIGHKTFSFGETCAELIDHYKLGTTVGGYTASTNGDMNFASAGKMQVNWTGMKVLKRDGSPYHGVGVKPEILIQPRLKDIRTGRDTQLEAAVEHLKGK